MKKDVDKAKKEVENKANALDDDFLENVSGGRNFLDPRSARQNPLRGIPFSKNNK